MPASSFTSRNSRSGTKANSSRRLTTNHKLYRLYDALAYTHAITPLHDALAYASYTIAAWSPLPDLRRALRGTEPPRRSLRLGGRWSPGWELHPVPAFIRRRCTCYTTGQRLTGQLRVSAFAHIALHPQRDPAFTTQSGSHTGGSGNSASHPEHRSFWRR